MLLRDLVGHSYFDTKELLATYVLDLDKLPTINETMSLPDTFGLVLNIKTTSPKRLSLLLMTENHEPLEDPILLKESVYNVPRHQNIEKFVKLFEDLEKKYPGIAAHALIIYDFIKTALVMQWIKDRNGKTSGFEDFLWMMISRASSAAYLRKTFKNGSMIQVEAIHAQKFTSNCTSLHAYINDSDGESEDNIACHAMIKDAQNCISYMKTNTAIRSGEPVYKFLCKLKVTYQLLVKGKGFEYASYSNITSDLKRRIRNSGTTELLNLGLCRTYAYAVALNAVLKEKEKINRVFSNEESRMMMVFHYVEQPEVFEFKASPDIKMLFEEVDKRGQLLGFFHWLSGLKGESISLPIDDQLIVTLPFASNVDIFPLTLGVLPGGLKLELYNKELSDKPAQVEFSMPSSVSSIETYLKVDMAEATPFARACFDEVLSLLDYNNPYLQEPEAPRYAYHEWPLVCVLYNIYRSQNTNHSGMLH